MGKIKVLSEHLTNKIAAGEVVERPASIVKELIENSLDASSSRIEIIIEDGGRSLIKVIDDGQGMDDTDLRQSFLPHATSKIYTDEDLAAIKTLGFRGEALASIAAVSSLKISSAFKMQDKAQEIFIEAGIVKDVRQTVRTHGTTVQVRNLFFNTPARLKFLKTQSTEMAHIIRTVTELALAYPAVSFRLSHKRDEIINCAQHKKISERIRVLLPDSVAEDLLPVSFDVSPLKIKAFLSKPGKGFSTRKNQYIFVNGRCVTDKIISHAITQGYHRALLEKQFPAVIIFIWTNPALVDVNVHPGKKEVRFQEASLIHDVLVRLIKDKLFDKSSLPDLPAFMNSAALSGISEKIDFKNTEILSGNNLSDFEQNRQNYIRNLSADNTKKISLNSYAGDSFIFTKNPQDTDAGINPGNILQLNNTYLVCSDKEGMIVIDQHAAHERVLFDELLAGFKNKKIEKQKLLIPITVSLNKEEFLLVQEQISFFKEIGFDVEEFGAQTIAVYSYPSILEKTDITRQFNEIIVELTSLELALDSEKRITQFLAPIACHCAIRAGEKLSPEQINSLFLRLWQTKSPETCPHGRPTIIKISWYELERKFKRK